MIGIKSKLLELHYVKTWFKIDIHKRNRNGTNITKLRPLIVNSIFYSKSDISLHCEPCLLNVIADHFPQRAVSFQTCPKSTGFRSFQYTTTFRCNISRGIFSPLSVFLLSYGNAEKHPPVATVKDAPIQDLRIMIICARGEQNVLLDCSEGSSFSNYLTNW